MDPSKEPIEPRPEAKPLRFDDLTEEQHEAGRQATLLLRGMAREPWNRANRQSPVHSYLPVIYNDAHSNRVILLDGARGSGKSALLITLLDAYGRALSEQQVPPKYEAWISPTDRIIPVGLIDLHPLPASTHLLFHLVASLERVVEAMETRHEPPRPGTAAWHPGGADESKSRRAWKHFARIAASGWDDNLNERKGKLDPEAFAVEVEQGELQRLDVNQAFREFMDALVGDYQTWNHWPPTSLPLFVLAIDDADMNEDLSIHLLELVRKLWHPRLAFLLTGDSELFISRLTAPPPPTPSLSPGSIQLRPTANLDDPQRRQLAMDRYAKVIPLKHRFRLKELKPNQRLVKGPRIEQILERLRVPIQAHLPGRPSGTLRDYFGQDSQILEALPGRLRHLGELADWLWPLASESTATGDASASAEAVTRIWQLAVRVESSDSRLNSMVQVDASGRLRIKDDEFNVTWEVEPRTEASTDHADLIFEVPIRAEVSRDPKREIKLGAQTTAALLLAANFIADAGASMANSPLAPGGMETPLLAHAILREAPEDGPDTYTWPLPDWDSFLDIELLRKDWESALATPRDPHTAERLAKAFLGIVLRLGLGAQEEVEKPDQEDPLSWRALAIRLWRAARLERGDHSERRRELARWALGRAGLLAAPESGLPAKVANALLDALRTSSQATWRHARQALLGARRERIALAFQKERNQEASPETVETLIHSIDQRFHAHQFRHWVEHVEGDTTEQEHAFTQLRDVLRQLHLPFLESTMGERGSPYSLEAYLTRLRSEWLRKAPAPMLQHIRKELAALTRFSDAGALALMRFWKAACESAGALDVAGALQSTHNRLTITEPYKKRLDEKTKHTTAGTIHLKFIPREQLSLSVHKVDNALTPILESTSASDGVNQALEIVLRMAYDHEKDQSGTSNVTSLPTGWRGIKVRFQEGQQFHPWPVPPWPTLFEWEFLEQSWSDALQLANEADTGEDTSPDIRIVDALAYWMISVCKEQKVRREPHTNMQLQPSIRDWYNTIRMQWNTKNAQGRDVRAWLYEHWMRRLPLMAAPESGLSTMAASNILAGLFADDISDKEEFEQRTLLPSLRRKHLLDVGIPEDQVDSLLTRIDQTYPDHPWVERFGPWKGTQDNSPQ